MPRPMPPLEGKFGRLRLVELTEGRNKAGYRLGRFACDCGAEALLVASRVARGSAKSCGCLTKEAAQRIGRSGVGLAKRWAKDADRPAAVHKTPGYRAWQQMRQRCCNPNQIGFERYGGRGITVCERWNSSFADFIADVGQRPSPDHSIERKDNDGNYEPGNCVWATMREQNNNRRNTIYLTHAGRTLPLAEWAREVGIGYTTLKERLVHGWSAERALTETVRRHGCTTSNSKSAIGSERSRLGQVLSSVLR